MYKLINILSFGYFKKRLDKKCRKLVIASIELMNKQTREQIEYGKEYKHTLAFHQTNALLKYYHSQIALCNAVLNCL